MQEVLSSTADEAKDVNDSSEELDSEEGNGESRGSRKKKNKRRKGKRAFIIFATSHDFPSVNINGAYGAMKAKDHE